MVQSRLVHKDRTEGKTAGSYQAACGHLAMALEDPFALLIAILNGDRAGCMQDAANFHPIIGVRVRTSCRRHHEATASRAPLLEVGVAVMMVSQQQTEFRGEFLEEARSLEVIGRIGGCALGRGRN